MHDIGSLQRFCKVCGNFVGRTDEFGLCEECRRIKATAEIQQEVKQRYEQQQHRQISVHTNRKYSYSQGKYVNMKE